MKIFLILLLLLCGCVNTNVIIDPIRVWEGHYYNTNDINCAIKNMKLQENESVWILSDSTLNRTLKNVKAERK